MHKFTGKWITNAEFFNLTPRNVFHKQLEKVDLPYLEHRNRHILFRKKFRLISRLQKAADIFDGCYAALAHAVLMGKDTKRNTSLFHLTFSYAALFITDTKW